MIKQQKGRLSRRLIAGFILLGLMISSVSCAIGYVKYRSTIQKLYNENAYAIAALAESYVDGDQLMRLLARDEAGNLIREREVREGVWEVTAEPYLKGDRYRVAEDGGARYAEMAEALNQVRKAAGVQYILLYIPIPDPVTPHLVYFFDAENNYFPSNRLGMTDPMNPKYFEDVLGIYETGEHSDSYFISHSTYGYTTSAMLPIQTSVRGEVAAILDVYVPMSLIESTLKEYITSVIAVTVLLVFAFVATHLIYLRRMVIRPIQQLTAHAAGFIGHEETLSVRELGIHTGDEIETLALALDKMEIDLKTYIENLTAVTAEKERIGAELDVATHIQASMLPCIFPAFPGRPEVDIYATMIPAKEVGGDFYDFFLVDDNHMAMVIADVSGKGVPAALFMVIAKTLLKNVTQTGLSPKAVLEKVNDQLCENNEAEMFVTVWLGILEISTGKLTCANAGHEYPAICRADGRYELIKDKHGFVLAGMEG
ncbi:MAG: SpoIIE family protein phosphatase, partial [Oscillospiraceae bacterium]